MRRYMGLRWVTIALIMVGAMVNFLSRQTLSIAAPTVIADLHITTQQYGWITSAFQGGIMLQPVVGYVIDVLGVKSGFALFAFLWSVICMLHGFAGSWQALASLRGLLGFAEGAFSPGGLKVVSEWFPAKERGLAGGLYNIGPSLGSMLAPPLVAWAILNYSWQASFVIVGLISLAWVALWLLVYRPVRQHPGLSAEERDYIVSGQEAFLQADGEKPSILPILKRRNFWGIALPRFLADPTWGMLTFWLPLYLITVRHFDLKHIALLCLAAVSGGGSGLHLRRQRGVLLQKRGVDLIDARRWAFTLGAFMMIGVAFTGVVKDPLMAVALISLAGFAHQTLSVTMITMASDLFPRNEVGTVAGMAGTCANLGHADLFACARRPGDQIGYTPVLCVAGGAGSRRRRVAWTVIRKPAQCLTSSKPHPQGL